MVIHLKKGGGSLQIRIIDKGGQQLQPYWKITQSNRPSWLINGEESHVQELVHHKIGREPIAKIIELLKLNGWMK